MHIIPVMYCDIYITDRVKDALKSLYYYNDRIPCLDHESTVHPQQICTRTYHS